MDQEPRSNADIARLVDEYPLAWVVSSGNDSFHATPLPMLAEFGAEGEVSALFGHFALSNDHVAALQTSSSAVILFMGPQGYMSPSSLSRRNWAPTWNYAIARFKVDVEFVPDETKVALDRLVIKMEVGRRSPWTIVELGDRLAGLARQVVAFRAHVRAVEARFKLGQDEAPETFSELVNGLEDPVLASWMRDFSERGQPAPPCRGVHPSNKSAAAANAVDISDPRTESAPSGPIPG